MTLTFKILIACGVLLVAALALFFGYAAYDYTEAGCYDEMHKTGLDRQTAQLLDSAGKALTGLWQGTPDVEKWGNEAYQDEIKHASHLVAVGRRSLEKREAFAALNSVTELLQSVARTKSIATDRINDILRKQDPADPDAFEKYRLEGKNLVEIVKQLDSLLEMLNDRPQKLPRMCDW